MGIASFISNGSTALAEKSFFPVFLGDDVDGPDPVAIIKPTEGTLVAYRINDLNFLDDVSRKVSSGHFGIIPVKWLSIHQNPGHRLTLGFDGSIAIHFYTRHFFQEVFGGCIGNGLELAGIEFSGVSIDGHGSGPDDDAVQHGRKLYHWDDTHIFFGGCFA